MSIISQTTTNRGVFGRCSGHPIPRWVTVVGVCPLQGTGHHPLTTFRQTADIEHLRTPIKSRKKAEDNMGELTNSFDCIECAASIEFDGVESVTEIVRCAKCGSLNVLEVDGTQCKFTEWTQARRRKRRKG